MAFFIGTPHAHNAGYFKNDDRVSGGKLSEADIQTCPHCQAVINMTQWKTQTSAGFCVGCNRPTCSSSECVECVPFLKRIEQSYELGMKLAAFRKLVEPPPPPRAIYLGTMTGD